MENDCPDLPACRGCLVQFICFQDLAGRYSSTKSSLSTTRTPSHWAKWNSAAWGSPGLAVLWELAHSRSCCGQGCTRRSHSPIQQPCGISQKATKLFIVVEPPARQAWREGEAMARRAVTQGHMLLTGASTGCRKSIGAKQHRAPNLRLPCGDGHISSLQARLLLETAVTEQLLGQFPSPPQLTSVKSLCRMCKGWIYLYTIIPLRLAWQWSFLNPAARNPPNRAMDSHLLKNICPRSKEQLLVKTLEQFNKK